MARKRAAAALVATLMLCVGASQARAAFLVVDSTGDAQANTNGGGCVTPTTPGSCTLRGASTP